MGALSVKSIPEMKCFTNIPRLSSSRDVVSLINILHICLPSISVSSLKNAEIGRIN